MPVPKTNLFKGDRVRFSQAYLNQQEMLVTLAGGLDRVRWFTYQRIGTIVSDTLRNDAEGIKVLWDGNAGVNGKQVYHPDDLTLAEDPVAIWIEPEKQGDIVRQQLLKTSMKRGHHTIPLIGMIVIHWYGNCVRVASFLPGKIVRLPGMFPFLEPELSAWCTSSYKADDIFDHYVSLAFDNFWGVDYVAERNSTGGRRFRGTKTCIGSLPLPAE